MSPADAGCDTSTVDTFAIPNDDGGDLEMKPKVHRSRGGLVRNCSQDPSNFKFPQLKLDCAALKDNLARWARRRIACSISFARSLLRKCYIVTCLDNVYYGTVRLIAIRE
jgi:hypothetical protein